MKYAPTVTPAYVKRNLGFGIKVLDCSYRMQHSASPGFSFDEFRLHHIPTAQHFDIDEVCDVSSNLPHALPSLEQFQSQVRAMGVKKSDRVVVYDRERLFGAPRAWWMFRKFGYNNVSVMNGSMHDWVKLGGQLEGGAPHKVEMGDIECVDQPHMVNDLSDVCHYLIERGLLPRSVASSLDVRKKQPIDQIVDARSPGRFTGVAPEPRPGLKAGHIPGSMNVPAAALLTETGTLKSIDDLWDMFIGAGVDLHAPIMTTCGSGVTAALLSLVLEMLGGVGGGVDGQDGSTLYDGSWSEYGRGVMDKGGADVVLPVACACAEKCPGHN